MKSGVPQRRIRQKQLPLELDRVIGVEQIVGHGRILMPAPAFANRGLREIFSSPAKAGRTCFKFDPDAHFRNMAQVGKRV